MSTKDSDSAPPADSATANATLVTHIENAIAELLGLIYRLGHTFLLLNLFPTRAASVLITGSRSPSTALPYTFLLVGCLLFSYMVAAASYVTESNVSEILWGVVRDGLTAGFSLQAVALRSLPLLVVSILCASLGSLAARPNLKPGQKVALLYLYGNQGFVAVFFMLSVSAASDLLVRIFGGDDFIIVIFLALLVLITIQGFRFVRASFAESVTSRPLRILVRALFPVLLLSPLPLTGYGLVATGLIATIPITRPELPLPPIRFLSATINALPGSNVSLDLVAVVSNPFEEPFVIAQDGGVATLILVSMGDFNSVGEISPLTKGTFSDLYDLAYYSVRVDDVQSESTPVALAKGQTAILRLRASAHVTEARVVGSQSVRSTLVQASIQELLRDKRVLVQLQLSDPTIERYLASEYFVVPVGGE